MKLPAAMNTPPYSTALRCPMSRSAIQPPGMQPRYAAPVYRAYTELAVTSSIPKPGFCPTTRALRNGTSIARMP
jgi:hypothetical protein